MSSRPKRNTGSGDSKQYRFYKSNLPTIVWHPNGKRKLADFKEGHFTTNDLQDAKILLDKGYPQIPVDATEPPDIIVRIPGKSLGEGENVGLKGENAETGIRVPVVQE